MSTPRLYSRIRVSNAQADQERLFTLLIDYIEHPDRALSVKEFVFCTSQTRCTCNIDATTRDVRRETREIYGTIRRALEPLDLNADEQNKWLEYLTWMEPEVVAERSRRHLYEDHRVDPLFRQYAGTLLLLMCPNVEKLTYENNRGPMAKVLMRNNYNQLPGKHLQKLRELTLLTDDNFSSCVDERFYMGMNLLSAFRLFHRLPMLEKIHADALTVVGEIGYRETFPPASSNVKRISLCHAELPSSVTGPAICMSRHLEEFVLTGGGRAMSDGCFFSNYPKTLARALACQKTSLRVLDLDIDQHYFQLQLNEDDRPEYMEDLDGYTDEFTDLDDRDGSMPKFTWEFECPSPFRGVLEFQDYQALTHLSIGIRYLLGPARSSWQMSPPVRLVDSLPRGLKYLMIRGYEKGKVEFHDAEIERFMAEKETLFPSLGEVRGIEMCIPSAKSVEGPDEHPELLWEPAEADDDWLEMPAGAEGPAT